MDTKTNQKIPPTTTEKKPFRKWRDEASFQNCPIKNSGPRAAFISTAREICLLLSLTEATSIGWI